MESRPRWYWPIARNLYGLGLQTFQPSCSRARLFTFSLWKRKWGSCSFQKEEFKKKQRKKKYNAVEQKSALVLKMN
jgi:hypothetical protein